MYQALLSMQSNILSSLFLIGNIFFASLQAQSQPAEPRMSKVDYINEFKDQAIREMHATGIPASITLAQGMLESDYGNSPLAKYARNHFGIKCHKGWDGPSFIQDDDEANECFRKYYSAFDSYRDHSEFLMTRDRYASLFDFKHTDYKNWAKGLRKAGYATNPKYADMLIKLIQDNELHQFDNVKKLPEKQSVAEMKTEKTYTRSESIPHIASVSAIDVSDNSIKFITAKNGDTPEKIAERFDMGRWQILKYNDLAKGSRLVEGEVIYLQPKRNNAKKEFHTVQQGETVREVSQMYGVKMKTIYKLNDLDESSKLTDGQRLKIRKIGVLGAHFTGR